MIRYYLIAMIGRAAIEYAQRADDGLMPWAYGGARRDCITVSTSAINWIVAGV